MTRVPTLEIIFEDDALVCVNKPGGLLTLPDRFDTAAPNLRAMLIARYGAIFVVHRLDRGTSGVICFAKTAEAHRHLSMQFGAHRVEKIYHALVSGAFPAERTNVNLRLSPHPKRKGLVTANRLGKISRTDVRVLETFRAHTLVECRPRTGRQHQIRVHLSSIGFPLAVDPDYGGASALNLSSIKSEYRVSGTNVERPLIERLTLHAAALTLTHPGSEKLITVEAAYPKDLRATLQSLRKFSAP